jgi:hypothetical protein
VEKMILMDGIYYDLCKRPFVYAFPEKVALKKYSWQGSIHFFNNFQTEAVNKHGSKRTLASMFLEWIPCSVHLLFWLHLKMPHLGAGPFAPFIDPPLDYLVHCT